MLRRMDDVILRGRLYKVGRIANFVSIEPDIVMVHLNGKTAPSRAGPERHPARPRELTLHEVLHGLHAVAPDVGLPALPDVEFTLFAAAGASARVADELGNAIALAFAHKG
jgi:hypothetical protein